MTTIYKLANDPTWEHRETELALTTKRKAASAGVVLALLVFIILVLTFVVYSASQEVSSHPTHYTETICSTTQIYTPVSTTTVGSLTSTAYTSVGSSVLSCTTQSVLH